MSRGTSLGGRPELSRWRENDLMTHMWRQDGRRRNILLLYCLSVKSCVLIFWSPFSPEIRHETALFVVVFSYLNCLEKRPFVLFCFSMLYLVLRQCLAYRRCSE